MAIVFALRGTSSTAYYAGGKATPHVVGTVTVDAGAATGVIGNSTINLDQGSFAQRSLIYDGFQNFPLTQKFSVLIRCAFGDTSNALQMFYAGGCGADSSNQARASGAGTFVATFAQKDTGASLLNQTYTFAYTTATYYDIVYTVDGTLTTSAVNTYKDATLVQTNNNSATRAATADAIGYFIALGTQNSTSQNQTRIKINEFVIWDTIIDPTSGGLNLNGSSRSSFVTATNFEGLSYTDPGAANVRLATSYTFAGTSTVGTAAIPAAANVRSGTATDATTGSLAVPAAGNVRSGTAVDAGTGTLVVPSLANTKTGVAGDGGTGSYDGSDRWTDPGTTHVESGTAYKANSTSNNRTGTLVASTAKNHIGPGRVG